MELCCGGMKDFDLLFGTPLLSMVLVLAPISLAEDWSSPLCCEALGYGGTHGFDLIPSENPNLSGACCSTISLYHYIR